MVRHQVPDIGPTHRQSFSNSPPDAVPNSLKSGLMGVARLQNRVLLAAPVLSRKWLGRKGRGFWSGQRPTAVVKGKCQGEVSSDFVSGPVVSRVWSRTI